MSGGRRLTTWSWVALLLAAGIGLALFGWSGFRERPILVPLVTEGRGNELVEGGVLPRIEDGGRGADRPREYAVYSWKERFSAWVRRVEDARRAAPPGRKDPLELKSRRPNEVEWSTRSGVVVYAVAGEKIAGHRFVDPGDDVRTDENWVTVYVVREIEDDLSAKLRMILER